MAEYFVVGSEQIVAQDLAAAIRANDQLARVKVLPSSLDAIEALAAQRPIAVIIYSEPEGFRETPLGQALVTAEIPFGFLCAECEAAGGAVVLQSPFNEKTVGVLLAELLENAQSGR